MITSLLDSLKGHLCSCQISFFEFATLQIEEKPKQNKKKSKRRTKLNEKERTSESTWIFKLRQNLANLISKQNKTNSNLFLFLVCCSPYISILRFNFTNEIRTKQKQKVVSYNVVSILFCFFFYRYFDSVFIVIIIADLFLCVCVCMQRSLV